MTHDWLLVETLGDEPAVVARGRELKKLVPITTFLRRSPYLAAVRTAIAETLQTGQSLTSITPKHDRVIRTEPVIMTDGRMHGVQVWSGPTDAEPPDRPIPGPLKWDLTRGVATDTPESLTNSGKNPEVEITYGRAFAEDRAAAAGARLTCRRASSIRTKPRCLPWQLKPSPAKHYAAFGISLIGKEHPSGSASWREALWSRDQTAAITWSPGQ